MNQSYLNPHGIISSTDFVDPNQFEITDYDIMRVQSNLWVLVILVEKKIAESEWTEGVAEILSGFVWNVLDAICVYQSYDPKTRKLEVKSIQGRT